MQTKYKNSSRDESGVLQLHFIETDIVKDLDDNEIEVVVGKHSLTQEVVEKEILRLEEFVNQLKERIILDGLRRDQLQESLNSALIESPEILKEE